LEQITYSLKFNAIIFFNILNKMNMFPTIRITKLSNGEYVAFVSDVVALFNRVPQATLTPFLTPLSDALVDLEKSYKLEQGNLLTKEIQTVDNRRDDAIKGIKKTASGYLYYFDAAMRSAAELIIRSLNKYNKNIDKMNYQEQTATVTSLLSDWANDTTLSNAIATLNFQAWQQELAAANTAFGSLYLDRIEDEAAKNLVPVSKQREAVSLIYKNLERKLTAYGEIDAATYLSLVNGLDGLIDKYNAL
jgi:hypothetical protein